MTAQTVGLAVFVKTPGLSPIKTRLAAEIGIERALAVYDGCLACIRECVAQAAAGGRVQPYWAVAESDGAGSWGEWPVLLQGEGGLGARMECVYRQLLQVHDAALLLGADAPALAPHILNRAAQCVLVGPPQAVLAPAQDGGFVLVGGNRPIASAIWNAPDYGDAQTLAQFRQALHPHLPIHWLPEQQDLDTREDLMRLAQCPPVPLNSAQRRFWASLMGWIEQPDASLHARQ